MGLGVTCGTGAAVLHVGLPACLHAQVAALEGSSQAVGDLRSTVGRLEATVASGAATISDLRARLATAEGKLEVEGEAKVRLRAWGTQSC